MNRKSKEQEQNEFMVVVRPAVEEKDEDTWLGSINAITTMTRNQIANQEKKIKKKTDKLDVMINRSFSS